MLGKGLVVVPHATAWTGPWLGATRRPSLQRVANRPIICHVLDGLLAAGVVEAAIVVSADAQEEVGACIAQEGPAGMAICTIASEPSTLGAEALLAAADFVGDSPCVLHRANGLLGEPLLPFVELLGERGLDALLLVDDGGRDTKRLRLVPHSLEQCAFDATPVIAGSAGVCLLGAGALASLPNREHVAQLQDFAALTEQLARDGRRVEARVVRKWHHFAGDAHNLLDMNRTMLDMLDTEASADAIDGNRFEGPIFIHPTARVTASVIIGPVMIGADALVADSYIGPHTSIGERVRIEGAELERSIVLADASVLHVGGRLVASIVGREARIFRDFSVPRALRLQVGDGDEVALC